jgi:hypothetical protein
MERVHDFRFLNAGPPADPVFVALAMRLRDLLATRGWSPEEENELLEGLATVARCIGRTWDAESERCRRELVERRPERWQDLYNLGLFFKTRGRFAEGLAANRKAAALAGPGQEDISWNLGICATGAGDGQEALKVWSELGQKLELGRLGLPEGSYHHVKVRLAERPIAERDRAAMPDDPGTEETIWVERLSPCHGIVRSALYEELGVEYGDLVLFDGAPIVHHTYDDRQVPVFPHLATLARSGYLVFRFAGSQERPGQLADLSERLPEDALLYVHTEQVVQLCASCWTRHGTNHADHGRDEHRVVRGKLCAPPGISPQALRSALDQALQGEDGVQLFVPDLTRLSGDERRADVEARRWAMLEPT